MNILRDTSGVTLLEAMVSLVIFSIGILAFSGMQSQTTVLNTQAYDITGVSNQIRALIEAEMGKSFTGYAGMARSPGPPGSPVDFVTIVATPWDTDAIDNDVDGAVDEYDERGIIGVYMTLEFSPVEGEGRRRFRSIEFLKTEIL